jgi:hypothetical protein
MQLQAYLHSPNRIFPALVALLAGTLTLSATEIRDIQTPAEMPKTITVGGAEFPAHPWLKPWVARDPAEYAGSYDSHTITDGRAKLVLKLYQGKSPDGDLRWQVGGTLETRFGVGANHVCSFKNAELLEPKRPFFDVIERVTSALFVWFTDPEKMGQEPRKAVVIGDQIYVRE